MKTTFLLLAGIVALALAPEVSAAPVVNLVKEPTVIKAASAGRTLFEYQSAPAVAFKPYIFQLYSPGGVAVLRDAPKDHIHHHGLMFALGVNGVTFWEEVIRKVTIGGRETPLSTDVRHGCITQQLDWHSTNGAVLLHETRTLTPHTNQNVTLLTWRCRLETPPGTNAVDLFGHPYYGLGMRFLQSMDQVCTFQNSSGQPGEKLNGDLRLVPAMWVACTGPAGDKFVTIAIFDHPGNLRYPAKKFTMAAPFSYIATTLNWAEPLQLKAGKPLDLCYGVAVWDGKVDAAQIEQACRQWQQLTPARAR
jgi:hypothetical protein